MGWLGGLLGQGKRRDDKLPDSFADMLDSIRHYITTSFLLAIVMARDERTEQLVEEMVLKGAERERARQEVPSVLTADPKFCMPQNTSLCTMGLQFANQTGCYVGRPSTDARDVAAFFILTYALGMESVAKSKHMSDLIKIEEAAAKQLAAEYQVQDVDAPQLGPKTAMIVAGIAVGNQMAQEFFAQYHQGTKPSPGDETVRLFHRHLILRHRKAGSDESFDIEPMSFVPDVGKWLAGEAIPLTIAVRAPNATATIR